MLEIGIKYEKTITVIESMLANVVDEELPPVYSTPCLVALMEGTSAELMKPHLMEEEGSVGMSIEVKHLAATPCGMQVRCISEVKEIKGKKVEFEINAYDENGLIGTAIHKRAIINKEKFLASIKN